MAMSHPLSPSQHRWLERYLLRPHETPLDEAGLELIDGMLLAPFAYTQVPKDHPARVHLQPRFMSATARHVALRVELQGLFQAWAEVGVTPLLFKGFYLAEFVYASPGQRFYNDIDVVIDTEAFEEASRLAQARGWLERWSVRHKPTMLSAHGEGYCGHELLQLYHPKLGVQLDVHRRILHNLHNLVPEVSQQARITARAWQASRQCAWGGATVHTLSPADSVLIGLVLNRCWSGDDWTLKPHDYLDFKALVAKFGLGRGQLEARAVELGCSRTLRTFLQRCNPFDGVLDMAPPSWWRKQLYHARILPERRHRSLTSQLMDARQWPGEAMEILRAWPLVRRALGLLEQHGSLSRALEHVPPSQGEAHLLSFAEWRGLKRGARRALQFVLRKNDPRYAQAYLLALYDGFRQRGCPVVLRRHDDADGEDEVARYWLEVEGQCVVDGRDLSLGF
jgi:hypothetical protein